MTPEAKRGIRLASAVFAASVLECAFAGRMTVRGACPDITLTVAILCASFCNGNSGAEIGFFAGLLHASFAAPPLGGFGSLVVSRTLVCFAIGALEERVFRDNVLIAAVLVALGTLSAELLFFIFDPQGNVSRWAMAAVLTVLYNVLLGLPLFFTIRRLASTQWPRFARPR